MAKASLKRIRMFIEMYNKQDVMTVRKCTEDEPADRVMLGQVVTKGYQVRHEVGDADYIYLCKTLTTAAECVNDIVLGIPMEERIDYGANPDPPTT